MQNRWNDIEAEAFLDDPLAVRVYTSRLLGREPDLVLHGGGNTSVKMTETDVFGEPEDILYVKGSGWDLATIEAPGFAPVRLKVLQKLAEFETLSDSDMVRLQRAAMKDPYAPNPSVEAILHAVIPFKFVDHTHADAVVTITNTPDGEARIRSVYGDRVIYVPYVMPGFILAKTIFEMTRDLDWTAYDGMVLLNHGLFTFHDDARAAYENMIGLVQEAEDYLKAESAILARAKGLGGEDLLALARLRKAVSAATGRPVIARVDNGAEAARFADRPDVASIATRGPITPDHVIRTKRIPLIVGEDPEASVTDFGHDYEQYFNRNADGGVAMLDRGPRWAVWPGVGRVVFGANPEELQIIGDITEHTIKAIQQGELMGGWKALPEKDLFDMEYWELEQAKLRKSGSPPEMQGKVALVTGAANGIGKACVEALIARGAVVAGLDLDPSIESVFDASSVLGMVCDVTDDAGITAAIEATIRHFGGLDIVVSNAGFFPSDYPIAEMDKAMWHKSLAVNLNAHQRLLTACARYLELGVEPAVVIIGSKNVPAPGPGAGPYSVAKAGLTQLARVAALEWGAKGIRVNIVHPDAVYDTGVWTAEVLQRRADHYGMSVEDYKRRNVLKTGVAAADVGELVCVMAGKVFSKTTGAQIPIDGGNERVI